MSPPATLDSLREIIELKQHLIDTKDDRRFDLAATTTDYVYLYASSSATS
jgi:hypothetical protein